MRLSAVLETVLYYRGEREADMRSFYRDVLGLEQVSEVAFRIGDSLVLLFESEESSSQSWPPPHGAKGPVHTCFLCDPSDYEAWKSRLQDRGVAIIDEITWPEGVLSFYFNDPAGNVLEIARSDMWPHGSRTRSDSEPASIPVAATLSFLKQVLPAPPARVLDVGCGRGEVLCALAAEGYAAIGIDIDEESATKASAGGGRTVEADFLTFEDEPFDVVFFGRSLHHIFPLSAALERAHELLAPRGLMVAEELAVESVDAATARWLYDLDSVLQAAGLLTNDAHVHHAGHHEPSNPSGPGGHTDRDDDLERWRIEHAHQPPLSTGEDMVAGIGSVFDIGLVERVPYLYRSFCERLEATPRGATVGRRVLELESAGIANGSLVAAGLRVVASPPGAGGRQDT